MSLPPPPPPGGQVPPPPPAGPYPPNYSYQAPGYQTPGYQTPGYQTPGYQTPGYQTPGYQPAAPARRRVSKAVAIAAVAAAGAGAVGSVLPWVTLDSDFGSVSNNGLDVDGKLTIVLAIAIGVMFVFALINGAVWPAITGIPVFALIALIGVIDVADVNNQSSEFGQVVGIDFEVGIGLWIVLAAGIAGTIISIVALATRSRPTS